jgi:uncharacterized protein (DUF2267 family)
MKASERPSASPATRRNRVLMTFAFAGAVTSLRRIGVVRRWTRTASRWARRGFYRPLGRDVSENRLIEADDVVLADRVRSSIGPLLKELDTPRVHVMAESDRVLLHGDIISDDARERLEAAVRRVPGVGTVASYLHVGLLPGDMRPSVGRVEQPSSMARCFHDALAHSGIVGRPADLALGETLRLVTDTIPERERAHVFAHLPVDVKSLVRCRPASPRSPVQQPGELFNIVRVRSGLRKSESEAAVRTIVHELRRLVPEECDDVAAVLPSGLKPLWA